MTRRFSDQEEAGRKKSEGYYQANDGFKAHAEPALDVLNRCLQVCEDLDEGPGTLEGYLCHEDFLSQVRSQTAKLAQASDTVLSSDCITAHILQEGQEHRAVDADKYHIRL